MQSYVPEKDQNKNIGVSRSIQKPEPVNMNPFFEYVSNSKSSTTLQSNRISPQQTSPSINDPNNPKVHNIKKSLEPTVDPRKVTQNYVSRADQKESLSNSMKNAQPQRNSHNKDFSQKRSRSRDQNRSRKPQNSQQSIRKQKKEENFRKTKLCPLYQKSECRKGSQCNFAHGQKELKFLPNYSKTRLCLSFSKGQCKLSSDQCRYAHGQQDLRALRYDRGYEDRISKDRSYKYQSKQNKYNSHRRDSQSTHKKDRKSRRSDSREDSRDRKKKHDVHFQRQAFYKKSLPINKDYQKYLYGDTEVHPPQFQNASYVIPGQKMSSIPLPDLYLNDAYSVNLMPSSVPPYKTHYPPISNVYEPQYERPPFRDERKQAFRQNQVDSYSFYDRNRPIPNKNSLPNQRQTNLFQYNPQQGHYRASMANQSYRNPVSSFHQNQYESFPESSKDSNKNFIKPGFSGQSYVPQSNQNNFLKQGQFADPLVNSSSQRGYVSGYPAQYGQKQPSFYQNEPFYNPAFKKTSNSNLNGFSSQSRPGSFNSKSGSIDSYPALDNTPNGQIPRYPSSFQKNRYSNFSNNSTNR